MWDQIYIPVAGSLWLSAAWATLPILVLFIALGVFRLTAWKSGLIGLLCACLVARFLYGMPTPLILSSAAYGAAFGLLPIVWIVYWAVALYRLTVDTGQFEIIKDSVGHLTRDPRMQALLIVIYLMAIGLILAVPPQASMQIPAFAKAGQDLFANVAPALGRLFGIADLRLDMRLTSLLAFIYTYHYLNWFIKADVIRWADIPRTRLAFVVAASAASTALYFYDYALGFTLLLALSLVHIVLEFPLDSLALRQLGAAIGQGVTHVVYRRT